MTTEQTKARFDCYIFYIKQTSSAVHSQTVIQGTGESKEAAIELFDHAMKEFLEKIQDKKDDD